MQTNTNDFDVLLYSVEFFIGISVLGGVLIWLFFFLTQNSQGAGLLFMGLFFLVLPLIPIVVAIFVFRDAKNLKNLGAHIDSPIVWALLSFFTFPIGVSLYLGNRRANFSKQITSSNSVSQTLPTPAPQSQNPVSQ